MSKLDLPMLAKSFPLAGAACSFFNNTFQLLKTVVNESLNGSIDLLRIASKFVNIARTIVKFLPPISKTLIFGSLGMSSSFFVGLLLHAATRRRYRWPTLDFLMMLLHEPTRQYAGYANRMSHPRLPTNVEKLSFINNVFLYSPRIHNFLLNNQTQIGAIVPFSDGREHDMSMYMRVILRSCQFIHLLPNSRVEVTVGQGQQFMEQQYFPASQIHSMKKEFPIMVVPALIRDWRFFTVTSIIFTPQFVDSALLHFKTLEVPQYDRVVDYISTISCFKIPGCIQPDLVHGSALYVIYCKERQVNLNPGFLNL